MRSLFDTDNSHDEKKNIVIEADELNRFQTYKALYMEKLGLNKFGNYMKFFYIKNKILILGDLVRRQIGNITLNFQLENFVNQTKKEQYYD